MKKTELLICVVVYGEETADEGCLIVLIGSSHPCSVVGGGLGLGEVRRCYCLEVSNPTQNKEDGRNVLRSPISVLNAAYAHTCTRAYKYIFYICMNAHVSVHPGTYLTQ